MNELVKIEVVDGGLFVSSRVVAEALGKEHKHVLDKCREVLGGSEFRPSNYVTKQGKTVEEYKLTKDGFILLCMNYQGYNDFKRAYIAEFNRMEQALKNTSPLPPLPALPQSYAEALRA